MPRVVKYIARVAKPGGIGYIYTYPKGYSRAAGKFVPGTAAAARMIARPANRGAAGAVTAARGRPPRIARGWKLHATPFEKYTRVRSPYGGSTPGPTLKISGPGGGFHLKTLQGSNTYYGSSQMLNTRRSITVNLEGSPKVWSTARPSQQINATMRNPFAQDNVSKQLKTYNVTGSSLRRLQSLYSRAGGV